MSPAEHQRRNDAVLLWFLRDRPDAFAQMVRGSPPAERRTFPGRLRNAGATAEELQIVDELLKERTR